MSEAPDAIGRYKIVSRIGQGGMGVLFLAFDPMLERQVAIKLLRDDSEELRERFAREARSVARLRHPHIVTIFDVGEQDGHPFIAMEYLQGQTLADMIRAALSIDVPRKLQVIDELCDGLAFAHKAGIVHRDVKPANVIVEHDGVVKILDFGIARIAESGMTQAGMLIGTLNYMSPEQVAGHVVDGRSDIFAVGAVLYELLAYRQAFPGGLQNGILNKIMHVAPPSLETVCPGLDAEVIRIVDRALEKDPDARYQDLLAMRKDLQRVKQRLEQNLPETVALRPQESPDTIGIEPTTPARRIPQTPRWGTDRDGLAKRRATQTAAHLEDARRAMDSGDFDGAVVAAEQALMLNAEEPDALRLLERARQALDDRQLKDWLARGGDLLQQGDFTEALVLAEHALTLAPGSPAALELRQAIDRSRVERQQARQREDAIRVALEKARHAFDRKAYDEAIQAAGEALELSPDLAEAGTLQARAREAIARDRQAEFERRVVDALALGERLSADGHYDKAIAFLTTAGLDDARIAKAIEDLQARGARIKREQEETRLREEKIAAALARAKETRSHEEAIAILNEALALDPARNEIRSLLEIRHTAFELEQEAARRARERDEQVAAMIASAASARSHDAALGILKEAQALDPARAEIRDLMTARQSALDAERAEARRVAERQRKIAAAIEKAGKTKAHEAAITILEEAAALDTTHAGAREALAARRDVLARERDEAGRLKQRQETIAAAMARAAATPSHEAAVAILREAVVIDGGHKAAREALTARQDALEREREEARQVREREDASAAALARAAATASHDAAIALLTTALGRDPGHAEISQALEKRRAALAEDVRQARERREKSAAALAQAKAASGHDAAIAILRPAQALDPENVEIRQALESRQAALAREQEEARRVRERQERIASAIASAKKTPGHEAAIALLKEALDLDPQNAEIRSLIGTRQTALDQEREQARLEAERQTKIANAIAQAKGAQSHEAAITLLNTALALDATNRDARRLLESREEALATERAEAKRTQAVEAARQSIAALILQEKFDDAEAALQRAEDELQAKKTLKDLRRQLRDARRAKPAARSLTDGGVPARSSALSPMTIGIAAAVLVVAAAAYMLTGRTTPSTSPTSQAPVTVNVPPSGTPANTTPPAVTEPKAPVPTAPPVAPPAPDTATPVPAPDAAATAANDAAAALAQKTAASIQLARQQVAQNALRQAAATAVAGLKADPGSLDLRRLETEIVTNARQQAAASRTAAAGRGASATGSALFKGAQDKEAEGVRSQRRSRSEPAVTAFLEAADLYGRADREAQQRAAAEPVSRPAQPDPTPPATAKPNPPVAEPPPVTNPTPPVTTPVKPPPATVPPPKPEPAPPSTPSVNDEEAIRSTLRAYAAAYASLDADAVQRVFPTVPVGGLRTSFAAARSYSVEIDNERISVSGTDATVTCRVRQTFVPKVGSRQAGVVSSTFVLSKAGGRWVITSRR